MLQRALQAAPMNMCVMRILRLLPVLALGLAASQPVSAQQPPMTDARVEALLLGGLRQGTTLAQFLEWRRKLFAFLDADGDGAVTKADANRQGEQGAAAYRADIIGKILLFDLNADGTITLDEAREAQMLSMLRQGIRFAAAQSDSMKKMIDAAVAKTMQADLNGDGRIDGAEMLAFARQHTAAGMQMSPPMAAALYVDGDGDGRTTLAEFLKSAEAFFRKIDAGGDDVISTEELAAYRKAAQANRPAPKSAPK
jgi:Ca2+-binding EF-hand superfamily protein